MIFAPSCTAGRLCSADSFSNASSDLKDLFHPKISLNRHKSTRATQKTARAETVQITSNRYQDSMVPVIAHSRGFHRGIVGLHGEFVLTPRVDTTGILGHVQIIKYHANVAHKLAHLLGDTAHAFRFDYTNSEATQASDIFRPVALGYPAPVFVEVPVDDVVTGVFDTPVATICEKHALRVGLLRGSTGDAIGDFTGVFTGLFVCELALDEESLADMREIQIAVELGCGPDTSDFNPAVIRWIKEGKVRILAVLEV